MRPTETGRSVHSHAPLGVGVSLDTTLANVPDLVASRTVRPFDSVPWRPCSARSRPSSARSSAPRQACRSLHAPAESVNVLSVLIVDDDSFSARVHQLLEQ